MAKDFIISIISTQVNREGEKDSIELVTKGKLYKKGNNYYIIYKESKVTGLEGTTTTLKVEDARVTLNRTGMSEGKQVFECGIYNCGRFSTQFGILVFGVHPKVVDVNLTDKGGGINLEYELEIEGELISYNSLVITVKEAD